MKTVTLLSIIHFSFLSFFPSFLPSCSASEFPALHPLLFTVRYNGGQNNRSLLLSCQKMRLLRP